MKSVGDIVDVVMIGDELAGQSGPLFSPSLYRKIVKLRQKFLARHLKSPARAKIWYHTFGDCWEYIPDLLDNGIDILIIQTAVPPENNVVLFDAAYEFGSHPG